MVAIARHKLNEALRRSRVQDEARRRGWGQSPRLICGECGCDSDAEARGWEAHLAREEDGSDTVVIFCPVCSVEV